MPNATRFSAGRRRCIRITSPQNALPQGSEHRLARRYCRISGYPQYRLPGTRLVTPVKGNIPTVMTTLMIRILFSLSACNGFAGFPLKTDEKPPISIPDHSPATVRALINTTERNRKFWGSLSMDHRPARDRQTTLYGVARTCTPGSSVSVAELSRTLSRSSAAQCNQVHQPQHVSP